MKWVWAGIFALLTLVCLAGLGVALWTTVAVGDPYFLWPALVLAANGVYSGMGLWAVLDS